MEKAACPDIWEGDKQIGHMMHVKIVKNKTAPPLGEADTLLLYKPRRKIIQILHDAVKNNIIEKSARNHKVFVYKEYKLTVENKGSIEELLQQLKENDLLMQFLTENGYADYDGFIADGDLTEEEVEEYLDELKGQSDKQVDSIDISEDKKE